MRVCCHNRSFQPSQPTTILHKGCPSRYGIASFLAMTVPSLHREERSDLIPKITLANFNLSNFKLSSKIFLKEKT